MVETQEQAQQVVAMSISELIYAQVKDLGKRMDRLEHRQDKLEEKLETTRQELNGRMDKLDEKIDGVRWELNARMDKQDAKIDSVREELSARMDKQDAKIDKLADKIDALHNEIKSSTGHISIANISTVGIALAVIYAVLK